MEGLGLRRRGSWQTKHPLMWQLNAKTGPQGGRVIQIDGSSLDTLTSYKGNTLRTSQTFPLRRCFIFFLSEKQSCALFTSSEILFPTCLLLVLSTFAVFVLFSPQVMFTSYLSSKIEISSVFPIYFLTTCFIFKMEHIMFHMCIFYFSIFSYIFTSI